MAARHVGAWAAALAVAKGNLNLYAGNDVEPHTREELDHQARGLEVFASFTLVAHLSREAVAHAVSFYRAFAIRFPDNFSPDEPCGPRCHAILRVDDSRNGRACRHSRRGQAPIVFDRASPCVKAYPVCSY